MREMKSKCYAELLRDAGALLEKEDDAIANTANLSALIYHGLPDLNWVGFYFLRGGVLVLGPFQGKIACTRIPMGKGVCGTAVSRAETVVVPNVHEFPGHIACDSASNSEIVVPVLADGTLHGVLDLDSPTLGRFDDDDREGLDALVALLVQRTAWDSVIGRR